MQSVEIITLLVGAFLIGNAFFWLNIFLVARRNQVKTVEDALLAIRRGGLGTETAILWELIGRRVDNRSAVWTFFLLGPRYLQGRLYKKYQQSAHFNRLRALETYVVSGASILIVLVALNGVIAPLIGIILIYLIGKKEGSVGRLLEEIKQAQNQRLELFFYSMDRSELESVSVSNNGLALSNHQLSFLNKHNTEWIDGVISNIDDAVLKKPLLRML